MGDEGKVLAILGRNEESAQAYERALELADKAVTEYKTSTDLNLPLPGASKDSSSTNREGT